MITLILGENGAGKTTYINTEYEKQPNNCTNIFFPTASELSTLLNDKATSNYQGADGTDKKPTYLNPLNELLKKILSGKNILDHTEHDDRNKKWVDDKTNTIWKSLNFDIDGLPDKDKFKKFCASLKSNITTKIQIVYPEIDDIVSKFSDLKQYSHGEVSFYFIKLCLKIIKLNQNIFEEIKIFFDEPDNYLHPKFIQEFIDEIVELNNKNKSEIFITSHNYYFISELINNIQLAPDKLTILKIERTAENKTITKYMDDDIKESKNCCAVRLLYDIYGVPTPDFLDYLIGESGLGFDSNGNADKGIVTQYPEFAIKDSSGNAKIINNGGFSHHSYVNLIRNWYHHTKDRSVIETDYQSKLNEKFNYDELLKKAIEQLVDWLTRNNLYKKIAFKQN